MKNKVSIIIPVYNVEKYLNDSINSAINQSYTNIEILIIDDGSKDNSRKICNAFSQKDKRIKVFHTENCGAGAARNIGLDIAKGDFIMFLDADDFLELDAVEKMLNAIIAKNADFITADYINTYEDGTKWQVSTFADSKELKLSINDPYETFFFMNSSTCNKIFKRNFLEKNNIKYVEGVKAEDAIFSTSCLIHSTRAYFMPILMYNYRQRKGDSASTNCSLQFFKSSNRAYREIYNNFKNSNNLSYYRYYYAKTINFIIFKFIDSDILSYTNKIEVLNEMMWFFLLSKDIHVNPCHQCTTKVLNEIILGNFDTAIEYCNIIKECRSFMTPSDRERMLKPPKESYKQLLESDVE